MTYKNYLKLMSICLFVTFFTLASCNKSDDSTIMEVETLPETVDLTSLPF
jgi:hypothetical protein